MGRLQDRAPHWGYRRSCLPDAVGCPDRGRERAAGGIPGRARSHAMTTKASARTVQFDANAVIIITAPLLSATSNAQHDQRYKSDARNSTTSETKSYSSQCRLRMMFIPVSNRLLS